MEDGWSSLASHLGAKISCHLLECPCILVRKAQYECQCSRYRTVVLLKMERTGHRVFAVEAHSKEYESCYNG